MALALRGFFFFFGSSHPSERIGIKTLCPGPVSPKSLKNSLAHRNDPTFVSFQRSWLRLQTWHGHGVSRAELGDFHVKEAPTLDPSRGRGQACQTQSLVTCRECLFHAVLFEVHSNATRKWRLHSHSPPFTKEEAEALRTCFVWVRRDLRVRSDLSCSLGDLPTPSLQLSWLCPQAPPTDLWVPPGQGTVSPAPVLKDTGEVVSFCSMK